MEAEQTMDFHPIDKNIIRNFEEQFTIRSDTGNFFTPGKPDHSDRYRCIYCQSNCAAELVVDGEYITLNRGDIVVIHPNVPHGVVSYTRNGEHYAGYVVDVSGEFMRHLKMHRDFSDVDFGHIQRLIHTRGTLWDRIDFLFLMALEEQEMKAKGWEAGLFGSAIVLLIQIARAGTADPTAATRMDKQELLSGILSYVETNLSEKITLEDVASRFFVSPSTITHLFNKRLSISFYKYVMQRRLGKAKNLIREGMPMEKIASTVGFNDYSVFYRAFKQEFGMSPRQYLKKNGEPENQ